MTTELTKALSTIEHLQESPLMANHRAGLDAAHQLLSSLAQRPAAQEADAREAFERAALAKWGPLDFERSEAVPEMYYNQRLDDAWIGFGFAVTWLRASLTAPQQATPEPVGDRCAQCKKAYRQGAGVDGCPKCAPGVRVSETEFQQPIHPAAAPAVPEVDPLQGAADWFWKAIPDLQASDVAGRLSIGYNRASRLLAAAQAKGGAA